MAKTSKVSGDSPAERAQAAGKSSADDPYRTLFVQMALEMTWQLGVVVIVPIVGGYYLDNYFHTNPWLTLLGLAIAAAGVFGVLYRIVKVADRRAAELEIKKDGQK